MRIDPGQGHIPRHATDKDGDTLQSPFLPDVQAVRFLVELAPFCWHSVNAMKLARQAWITTFLNLFSILGLYAILFIPLAFPWGIIHESDSPSWPIISHTCKSPRGSMTMDSMLTTPLWVTWKTGPICVVPPLDPSSPMD